MSTTPAPPAGPRLLRAPRLRAASRDDWAQLVRFCVVGSTGYVVNLVVFGLLVHVADAHHLPAAVGAFAVAWSCNFVFNKYWTFRSHRLSALHQAARYLAVSLAALALNLVILDLLVQAELPRLLAQAIAIAAVTPVNFLLNRRWSFR